VCFHHTVYGEGQVDELARNLRGRVFQSCDSAGVLTSAAYDFKGNLLAGTRQLASDYKGLADWSAPVELEAEIFMTSHRYDALNRAIQITAPHAGQGVDVIQPGYDETGLLCQVDVWPWQAGEPAGPLDPAAAPLHAITEIRYNARGQRESIAYGCGVETRYEYDPLTFNLTRLRTTRTAEGDLQDLNYAYDPSGNLTGIRDHAQQVFFFANTAVSPEAGYTYDALYQLVHASGREHIGLAGPVDYRDPPIQPLPNANQAGAVRPYTEAYAYSLTGSLLEVIHQANGGSWTRRFQYDPGSNRISADFLPCDVHSVGFF
jgi:YD repeat-containing protein